MAVKTEIENEEKKNDRETIAVLNEAEETIWRWKYGWPKQVFDYAIQFHPELNNQIVEPGEMPQRPNVSSYGQADDELLEVKHLNEPSKNLMYICIAAYVILFILPETKMGFFGDVLSWVTVACFFGMIASIIKYKKDKKAWDLDQSNLRKNSVILQHRETYNQYLKEVQDYEQAKVKYDKAAREIEVSYREEYEQKSKEMEEKVKEAEETVNQYIGIVPAKYQNKTSIQKLCEIFEDGRADTLKEAINVMVADEHATELQRMEQQRIQEQREHQAEVERAQRRMEREAERAREEAERHNREMEREASLQRQEASRQKNAELRAMKEQTESIKAQSCVGCIFFRTCDTKRNGRCFSYRTQ